MCGSFSNSVCVCRCVCLNDADRWHTHQLLDHPFLRPPSPVAVCPESSPEGEAQFRVHLSHNSVFIITESLCSSDTGVDFASTVVPRSHLLSAPFSTEVQKQFSRYYNEFSELQLLGKGAFGAVIKVLTLDLTPLTASCVFKMVPFISWCFPPQVQNKLDGCYYAVKRIQVNPASKQFRRIKGEVTLLSRLNHENIVRYYNAWIERHETPPTGALTGDSSESFSSPERLARPAAPARRNELGLTDTIEEDAPPPALASSVEWSTSLERSSSAKCGSADDEEDDDEEEDVFCLSFL